MGIQDGKLLTIAIPTYNRAPYLEQSLSHICWQLKKNKSCVEILVSDNNSTDNSSEIVNKYISKGFTIKYIKNRENIGSDKNFLQCFIMANSKYVLILGDDDILLDGSIEKILDILEGGNYGIVHLSSYGFVNNFILERPIRYLKGYIVYNNLKKFIRKVNYFLTFTSVNIINKSLVPPNSDLEEFINTNLIQLGWTFPALLNSQKNVFVREYLIAAKLYNSGGYRLCEVFGVNFNKISYAFISKGVNREFFEIVNKKLLSRFFPANVIRSRMDIIKTKKEDYYKVLYPLYKGYIYFWIFTLPAIVLPRRIAYSLFFMANVVRKLL